MKDNTTLEENHQPTEELTMQLKQRGYSSRATREILKWYAVGDCEVHETCRR
jgi:predicted Ser/Thr protein kinase